MWLSGQIAYLSARGPLFDFQVANEIDNEIFLTIGGNLP